MSAPFEGIQPRTVDILPDHSLSWEVVDVPSYRAKLYVSPHCSQDLAAAVVRYTTQSPENPVWPKGGDYGLVYEYVDDTVLKVFKDKNTRDYLRAGDLDDVVANVALSVGLGKISQRSSLFSRESYTFSAPEIHAVAIPNSRGYDNQHIVWAMERIDGDSPIAMESLPSRRKRKKSYERALEACGLPKTARIDFDDKDANMLIRPSDGSRTTEIVKIDIMAGEALGRYYQ